MVLDPWASSLDSHRIPEAMIDSLMDQGVLSFGQIWDDLNKTSMKQAWIKAEDLGFEVEERFLWEKYYKAWHDFHIRLME